MMSLTEEKPAGFTLVELVAVVALLAILGTGALLGLKHHRESANFRKVVRDLNAIDLATSSTKLAYEIGEKYVDQTKDHITKITKAAADYLPRSYIAGLAV